MRAHDQHVDKIALEIARYLRANPDAADSAEGVRQWWLAGNNDKAPLSVVHAALARLVADRVVRVRVLADGTRLYSATAAKPCVQGS